MSRIRKSPTEEEYLNASLRSDLLAFVHRCFLVLNHGENFVPGWHIKAICHVLEKVLAGEITRLIINAPPRMLKSIIVSVAFPAFLLGHNPRRKIFNLSYSEELAAKHARDGLAIVRSRFYQNAFPGTRLSRWANSNLYTSAGGFRKAGSTHATLTGLGGDTFIIDDPLKAADAQSDALRNHVNEWFMNTLMSRLDNKMTGAIIVAMQRLHQDDLTGRLLEASDSWTHLNLPAIAEIDEDVAIGNDEIIRRLAGEALQPDREPVSVLEALRKDLGPTLFASQFQQNPVPMGGTIIRREWLRYYDHLPDRRDATRFLQSWDTASKGGLQNDWSVCTTWQLHGKVWYLVDLTRGRYDYVMLRSVALELAKRFEPHAILVEDTSTGTALARELTDLYPYPVLPVPIEQDKLGRLYVQQAKFAAGLVRFPKYVPFLPALETELLSFPQGKYDDQVDSISQALAYDLTEYDYTYSGWTN